MMTHITTTSGRFRGFGLLIVSLFFAVSAFAATPSQLYIFGDSLSDTGNVFASNNIPFAPYVGGRFSNGPIWVETLAANLGLSAAPALLGGTNFAFGGAATGNPPGSTSPTLVDQAGMFLNATGGLADPHALYVVWGGGNDVRAGTVDFSVTNLSTVISTLAGAGATNFLVPNLPDIGLTPEALGGLPGASAGATFLSVTHNNALAIELGNLRTSLAVTITELDVFSILNDIIANPASLGYTNVDTACYDGVTGLGGAGNVCSNPDEYIFWDGIHPTAKTHAILGEAATLAIMPVPVPAAVWLFGSALGLLGWMRRSR